MNKEDLAKKLDQLISDADEQTQIYESSVQRLYKTLGDVYLWWREARKYEGFLEELYQSRNLVQRGQEEKFTRLVSLVWQIDWSGHEAPKLQNWARALRGLHHEYETNKDAYQVKDAAEKIRQFFNSVGGIGAVGRIVSPLQQTDEEVASGKSRSSAPKKKSDLDILNDSKVRNKHIELGERYFAASPPYHKNIVAKDSKLNVTRKGYAVALVRRSASGGLDLVSVTNNESIVYDTIIETYKRNEDALPSILRTLTEAIRTQALPLQFEKHRQSIGDLTEVLASDGKTRLRAVRRLLLRPKAKDILLSECRTDCSVVTIVKPLKFPTNVDQDITLRAVNHKYIEQNMLQTRDLCFYTTETKKLERLEDENLKANYRLQTKNTVTDRIHNLYFYNLADKDEGVRAQADLNLQDIGHPIWVATVDKKWIDDLNAICVSNWLSEFGAQLNRDRHKLILLSLSNGFEISYDGTKGHYTKTEKGIPQPKVGRRSKALKINFRSKDIFPVLSSLQQQEIVGSVSLAANENLLTIAYKTNHASYLIAVPTCSDRGQLNKTAFKVYEA